METRLLFQASAKFISGVLLIILLLFLPAGTLSYWRGWLLIAVLFLPMLPAGILLWARAPKLLEKRLHSREKEQAQKEVILLSLLMFAAGFITAGLDFRYGWSRLPVPVSIAAAVVLLCSYGLYAEVLRENAYLSRTVEVQEGQKVIDTGLYAIVRHPMYFATVLLFLSMPLVCGSLYAFLIFLIYPLILVRRIRNEEALLTAELAGYREYTEKVRYRMIPFIW